MTIPEITTDQITRIAERLSQEKLDCIKRLAIEQPALLMSFADGCRLPSVLQAAIVYFAIVEVLAEAELARSINESAVTAKQKRP